MDNDGYMEINGQKIKIPDIALGKTVPPKIQQLILEKEEAEHRAIKAERKAKLYFWGGILANIICMIGGWLLGKFCG